MLHRGVSLVDGVSSTVVWSHTHVGQTAHYLIKGVRLSENRFLYVPAYVEYTACFCGMKPASHLLGRTQKPSGGPYALTR